MNITSRQLKAFVLTARYESFSRAAEQLFITQSGMSVLVRELESQLGFRLFERTTRKVTLTDFGLKFLPIADRSLRELESAALNLSRSAAQLKHSLAIGAAPFPAAELLPRAISAYSGLHPEVQITLIDAEGPQLAELVQSGKVDAALTASSQEISGVVKVALASFSLMLICADSAGRGLGPEVRWRDIAALRLVGFPARAPVQRVVDEQLAQAGRTRPPELVCNYLETIIAMVEVGAGAAVVPTYAAPACAKRGISLHAIVDPAVTTDFYWMVKRASSLSPGAAEFAVFLKEYLLDLAERWPVSLAQTA
jgi:LysR family carnitine catabolism transcriptional activator